MVTPRDPDRSGTRPVRAKRAKRLAKGTAIMALAPVLALPGALTRADASPATTFDPALVATGARLAAIGDCIGCHTAPDGKPYAGGRALPTPFGTVHGTNITPDPDTGIGRWSEAAFVRAMREGVDAEGRHLYPVFPYDHFRLAADADLHALYAYLMTRDPVSARPPPNDLRFPFNLRPLIAFWKMLYLTRGAVPADPERDAQWNRGAYLVAGLGHCGACHTPRNRLGAERWDASLSGGEAEGWHAPALDAASPAPAPWTVDTLFTYLRGGIPARHDIAGGPMAPVTRALAGASQEDVRAIAAYVASLGMSSAAERERRVGELTAKVDRETVQTSAKGEPRGKPATLASDTGRTVYAGACAQCHEQARGGPVEGALPLSLSSAVAAPTPRNLVQITLHGIAPPPGERGAWMPAFGGAFTDAQVAALADYVRVTFSDQPPWKDVESVVKSIRQNPEG
jgi:mono/diheme cytochrome c family protein